MKTLSHIKTVSGLKLVGNEQIFFLLCRTKILTRTITLWWGLSNKKICTCEIEFILKLVNFKEKITTKTMFIKYKNKTFLRIPVCCYCFGGHTNIFLFFFYFLRQHSLDIDIKTPKPQTCPTKQVESDGGLKQCVCQSFHFRLCNTSPRVNLINSGFYWLNTDDVCVSEGDLTFFIKDGSSTV